MVEVIRLQRDEHPRNTPRALVDLDRSQGIRGMMHMMVDGKGAIFYVTDPYGEAEQSAAIRRATDWAKGEGIAAVYVTSAVGC